MEEEEGGAVLGARRGSGGTHRKNACPFLTNILAPAPRFNWFSRQLDASPPRSAPSAGPSGLRRLQASTAASHGRTAPVLQGQGAGAGRPVTVAPRARKLH